MKERGEVREGDGGNVHQTLPFQKGFEEFGQLLSFWADRKRSVTTIMKRARRRGGGGDERGESE